VRRDTTGSRSLGVSSRIRDICFSSRTTGLLEVEVKRLD
jgi:hypothetical protein